MLSLQYLSKRLKKSHIEQIQNNYNIKYTTMKNEIENKINMMIKTFNEDISAFLNIMQEFAEKKQQLRSLENKESEVDSLREKIKDSIHEKTKLRREVELLRIENNRLKYYSTNNNNNSNNNNNNTSRKKFFSPSATSRETGYQPLNTISNFNSPPIKSPKKKPKDNNNLLIKTEKKERKDSRLFKSPQVEQFKKTKKKLSVTTLENNKPKTILRKKDKTKTITSPISSQAIKKKTIGFDSSKNLIQTNKNTHRANKDFNKSVNNSLIGNKIKNSNKKEKTKSIFNQKKELSKTIMKTESFFSDKIKKDSEAFSSEKESSSNSEKSITITKSKITTEDNDEEQTIIEDEISEMNFIEEEILSVMQQIKEFKDKNIEINGNNGDENNSKIDNNGNNENIVNNGLT